MSFFSAAWSIWMTSVLPLMISGSIYSAWRGAVASSDSLSLKSVDILVWSRYSIMVIQKGAPLSVPVPKYLNIILACPARRPQSSCNKTWSEAHITTGTRLQYVTDELKNVLMERFPHPIESTTTTVFSTVPVGKPSPWDRLLDNFDNLKNSGESSGTAFFCCPMVPSF